MLKRWLIRLSVACNLLIIVLLSLIWVKPPFLVHALMEPLRDARTDLFESYPVTTDDVVFLGDSITRGAQWNEMFPTLALRNRGTGGDTTTEVLTRLHQVQEGKPKAVFLKIGTNDLTHGPGERQESYRQYRDILQGIKASSPNTKIFTQSILPRDVEYKSEIEAFNQEIERMSSEMGLTYINLYEAFLAEDGSIIDAMTYDELHLNGAGYRHWQTLLKPYVDAL